jgi:hypothetical protein
MPSDSGGAAGGFIRIAISFFMKIRQRGQTGSNGSASGGAAVGGSAGGVFADALSDLGQLTLPDAPPPSTEDGP